MFSLLKSQIRAGGKQKLEHDILLIWVLISVFWFSIIPLFITDNNLEFVFYEDNKQRRIKRKRSSYLTERVTFFTENNRFDYTNWNSDIEYSSSDTAMCSTVHRYMEGGRAQNHCLCARKPPFQAFYWWFFIIASRHQYFVRINSHSWSIEALISWSMVKNIVTFVWLCWPVLGFMKDIVKYVLPQQHRGTVDSTVASQQ